MRCDECRFWSAVIAKEEQGIQAMCLCPQSALREKYTHGSTSCMHGKINALGSIDDPDSNYEEMKRAYQQYDLGGAS